MTALLFMAVLRIVQVTDIDSDRQKWRQHHNLLVAERCLIGDL